MIWTQNVSRHVLPNGLTLLVERRRDAPAISVVTHVKAGYFDEPDEWVGISHVLEHMFFKGTPTRPNGVLARDTENLGGMLNAATIYDKTMYYTVVPSAAGNLAKAVSLQSDALQNLSLDRDELQREIEVIVQEVNRKRDNPDAMASETLHELLFQKHRIRRWRIGTESGLRALRAEDVRSYYETRYSPERTIVAIVGDIDADEAVSLAEKEYGSWQRSFVAPDTGPVETDLPQPRVRILKGDVQNPSVFLGWRTVDDLHSDRAALDLVAAVAGRGRGSWLNEAVRAEGLASVVRSFHYTTSEVGLFEIMFKTDADRVEEVVEKCLALVNRIRHTPPVEDDLLRVRSLAMTQWAGSLESTEGRAMLWCDCEALGGYELADKWYEEMMSVSVGELSRVAEEYLDSNRASLVAYCPREADLSGIERDWPRTPDPLPSRKPASMNVVSISRRQAVPSSAGSISFNRREKFDSLTRVKSGTGVVSLGIYFEGCRSAETEDVSGISSLLVRSALRGAGGMEERELAVAGEMLGGTIHPVSGSDVVGWNITVRPDALVDAAALLKQLAGEGTFEGEQVRLEAQLQAHDAQRERDDMFRYPFRRLLETSLPGSRYGMPSLGLPEIVVDFGSDLVKRWSGLLATRRPLVVAVGDAAQDELMRAAEVFDDWKTEDADSRDEPVQWNSSRQNEARDKAQTALAMAFACPSYPDPANPIAVVTGSILSGMGGRLFDRLREKKSLAYTVMAVPWLKREVGAFVAYIATDPQREDEARDGMLKELRLLAEEPVSEEELFRARNSAAGRFQLNLQSTHAMASEMMGAWLNGDLDGLNTLPERIRSVTAEDVLKFAGAVFEDESWAEFVLRGKSGNSG